MTSDTQRLDHAFLGMRSSLYRAILRIVRDAAEAEELTHDAYLRARRALDQNSPGNIEAFLWQTARNLALDHLRRRKVRALHEDRDFDAADAVVVADPQPSVEDQAIQRDMVRPSTGHCSGCRRGRAPSGASAGSRGWPIRRSPNGSGSPPIPCSTI